MKKFILLFALISVTTLSFAQDFELPDNYKLEDAKDYAKHKQTVIDAYDWFISTPPGEQTEKREEVMGFIIQWVSGSPSVTLSLHPATFKIASHADFLTIFFGAWTKAALESDGGISDYEGNMAGVNAVIDYYSANKEHYGKQKAVEKFIKLKNKGKLESFVKSKIG